MLRNFVDESAWRTELHAHPADHGLLFCTEPQPSACPCHGDVEDSPFLLLSIRRVGAARYDFVFKSDEEDVVPLQPFGCVHCGQDGKCTVILPHVVAKFRPAEERLERLDRGRFSACVVFHHVRIKRMPASVQHFRKDIERRIVKVSVAFVIGICVRRHSKDTHGIQEKVAVGKLFYRPVTDLFVCPDSSSVVVTHNLFRQYAKDVMQNAEPL